MADTKISALTTASTLDGTEVFPIVQSSTTKKVSVDNFLIDNAVKRSVSILNCPLGIAPSGTVGDAADSNLLVLGTALPEALPDVFLYFPANAVESGSAAGFYYCSMTTTTNGQVYADTFLSVVDTLPTIPSTPTEPTTGYSSATAFTGVATTISDAFSLTITGGSLGVNGFLETDMGFLLSNTAGSKGAGLYFDGVFCNGWLNAANKVVNNQQAVLYNSQSESKQLIVLNRNIDTTSDQLSLGTSDTSANVQLTLDIKTAVATDFAIVHFVVIEIFTRN